MADGNSYNSEIRNRINTFESQYYQLSRSVGMYGRYNTWVRFECNGLVVDSVNPVNKRIILQTWEYNKNGSGKANNFTLRICYDFANSAELYKRTSIHYVEEALCLNEIIEDSGGFISGYKNNASKLKCKFRYGYVNVGASSTQVLSQSYEGMITSCVPELRDNMLFYTIKGVSGSFGGHDTKKFSFPAVSKKKATDLAKEVLDAYYGSGYKSTDNKQGQLGFANTLTEPYEIINKTESGSYYSLEKPRNFDETTNTVFGYVNKILSQSDFSEYLKKEEMDNIPNEKKPHYVFYVDDIPDSNNRKRIVIDLIDPLNIINKAISVRKSEGDENFSDVDVPSIDSTDYDTSIVFQYPDKNQNFILSFLPKIDLNVIWAGTVVSDSQATRWGIDDGGILLKTESVDGEGFTTVTRVVESTEGEEGVDSEGTSKKEVASGSQIDTTQSGTDSSQVDTVNKDSGIRTIEGEESISSFARATDISYRASLSCLGIPCDIPIGTRIKIQPILNGTPYMFSGSYYILSCSDRIDSSGYITDMELFRLSSRNDNIIFNSSQKYNSSTSSNSKEKSSSNTSGNSGGGGSSGGSGASADF